MFKLDSVVMVLALMGVASSAQGAELAPNALMQFPANPEADACLQQIVSALPQKLAAMDKALSEQGVVAPLLDDVRMELLVFADRAPSCDSKLTARLLELVLERSQRRVTADLLLRFNAFSKAFPGCWQATMAALIEGSAAPELAEIQASDKRLDEVAAMLDAAAEAGTAWERNPPPGYLAVRQVLSLPKEFSLPGEALKMGVILRCQRNRLDDARLYAKQAIERLGNTKASEWFQKFLADSPGHNPYPGWSTSANLAGTTEKRGGSPGAKK